MKKLILTLLVVLTSFLTLACIESTPRVDISLTSEVSEAVLSVHPFSRVNVNSEVTIIASLVEGYLFIHWLDLETDQVFATEDVYTFIATKNRTFEAVYARETFDIILESNLHTAPLTLSEEGPYQMDQSLTVTADAIIGYTFIHWLDPDTDTILSTELSYTFTVIQSQTLRAIYIAEDAEEMQLHLSANIDGTPFEVSEEAPYETGQTITIEAQNVSGYNFIHWVDLDSGQIVSAQPIYTFSILISRRFEAIYIDENDDVGFPNESTRLTLVFDEDMMFYYSYGDIWIGNACVAIDTILGEQDCMVYGSVNTASLGEYTVTYYALDADGFYASATFTKMVFRDASFLYYSYANTYYEGIEGLYGEDLMLALRAIIQNGVTMQTYGDARDILQESDRDPLNSNNIILVYLGSSVDSTWDLGATWNREHVWPQSLLSISTSNTSTHIGADLHNLKPANPSMNSSRGNKYYDWATTTSSYAPRDEVKGDLARILFYMITMYDYLDLVNGTPNVYEMALLDVLLEWHYFDSVDAFEENRNDVIYFYQNNRNPFIDHPYLLELIWYNHPVIESLLSE